MKNKLALLILGTFLMLLLFGILIFLYITQKNECMNSPFTYGAGKISQGNLSVMCTCYFNDFKYAPFYFDKHNVTVGTPF
jgi:hypothetical protein